MKIFTDSIQTLYITLENSLLTEKLFIIITNNNFAIEFQSIKLIFFTNSFFSGKSVRYPRILNLNDVRSILNLKCGNMAHIFLEKKIHEKNQSYRLIFVSQLLISD